MNSLFGDAEATHGDMDFVLRTLETHFMGSVNVTYKRYVFNQRNKQDSETFETYLTVLRQLVRTCNYQKMTNELLRDRLVCGIKEDSIRKVLLQKRNLTLPEVIDICKSAEIASTRLKSMADLEKQEPKVYVIRKNCRK